jgi:hypothetical protein
MSHLVQAVEADCGRDLVKASARVRQLDFTIAGLAALSPLELAAITLGLVELQTTTTT